MTPPNWHKDQLLEMTAQRRRTVCRSSIPLFIFSSGMVGYLLCDNSPFWWVMIIPAVMNLVMIISAFRDCRVAHKLLSKQ